MHNLILVILIQTPIMKKISILNFSLSLGIYSSFIDYIIKLAGQKRSSMVCFANVHMLIEAHKDQKFLQIINNSDLVTFDGRPLVWALKLLYGIKQERVAGMDLLPDLLHKMSIQNSSAYFYGGTEAMLNNTKTYLKNKFPKLKIAGFYTPPFCPQLNCRLRNIEDKKIIAKINDLSPSVVFVVLGCPKQEKWMASMKNKINTVMIGIGGALPVMLGMQKRAPVWMQNNGLEWLFRLAQEPRRLFRRYASTNSLFLWIFLKEYLRVKIFVPLGFSKLSPGTPTTTTTMSLPIAPILPVIPKVQNSYVPATGLFDNVTAAFEDTSKLPKGPAIISPEHHATVQSVSVPASV